MRYLILLLLALTTSCRKDLMPAVTTCVLGKLGHGRCVDSIGHKTYKDFNELVGHMTMSPADAKQFTAWCYKANPLEASVIKWRMSQLLKELSDE